MAPTVKANEPSEVQIGELELHSASYFAHAGVGVYSFVNIWLCSMILDKYFFFGEGTQTTSA